MARITVLSEGREVACDAGAGETLLEALLADGVALENPCGGKGVCGKCRVRFAGGGAPEPDGTERKLLSAEELDCGVRLACLHEAADGQVVELPSAEQGHEVLTTGLLPEFEHAVDVEKRLVEIRRPTLDDQTPFEEQLCAQLGVGEVPVSVLAGTGLQPGAYTAVLHGGRVIGLELGDTRGRLYGAAIDIGTTTVVCELVDLGTGEVLADASRVNAQKSFGMDVLTRISYEIEHPEDGARKLQRAIVGSLNAMLREACEQAGVDPAWVYELAVGANCTMTHMLLGVDARPIGTAPFAPVFARAQDLPAAQVGLEAAPGARLCCLPQVSAYIGADIVAGARVCDLRHQEGNVLFIDIGTNGEIVLASAGRLLCCSCAAGPALEGMNISCGMRAALGAVEEVRITPGGNVLSVIGGGTPQGLCGSGILAVMRELLRVGLVRKNGAFVKADAFGPEDWRSGLLEADEKGKRSFVLAEGDARTGAPRLLVTQGDVRQVQLAKGAILSGFTALLKEAGVTMAELDRVIVAGQFGAHLSASSITGAGLLPPELEDRIEYAGNTSETGAYMALMSSRVKREMEALAHEMGYLELSATEGYERLFSKCLMFPAPARAPRAEPR